MTFSAAETEAMLRALALAARPGVSLGGNPAVGCVLLAPDGTFIAGGQHRGAGTAHAEVAALRAAGRRAEGATAVVTLEPCNHTGRTGPCALALHEAGVARVVYAQADPTSQASGGAATLRARGVEVESGLLADRAAELTRYWTFAVSNGRPFVTWKFATSLDGRSAAADGTSRWVTSRPARLDTHLQRAEADTMLVGTGTVLIDDPALTVRDPAEQLLADQPLRAVMGLRDIPGDAKILDDSSPSVRLRTRDPEQALADLFERGSRHVFLEGGPTLAAAFVTRGLVDRVIGYVSPMLLGAGLASVGDLGITTISQAVRILPQDITVLGSGAEANVRIIGTLGERL